MRRTVVVVLVLGIIAAAGWWFVLRPDAPFSLNRDEPGTATTRQPMPQDEVQRFESALNSPDREKQAGVMTPELKAAYLAQEGSDER